MATKQYKANFLYSVNVAITPGVNKHISFKPTLRGSMYTTSNEAVQKALESNSAFGSRFFLAEVLEDAKESANEAKPPKRIEVSDISEARDYLTRELGVPPSKLRGVKAIKEAALANNVEFIIAE